MKLRLKLIAVTASSFFILWAGVSLGTTHIPLGETMRALFHGLFALPLETDNTVLIIVWQLRFPRALLAFMVGGALAVSGTVFQSVLKNPLASPFLLGVSSGASLGAALIILTGITIPFISLFTLPLAGFVFGLGTVFIVIWCSSRLDKNMSNNTVILFGLVFSLFINAILTTLVALYREEMRNLLHWQMGSFALRGWEYSSLLLPFLVVGLIVIFRYTREMDILSFGEEQAQSLGVDSIKVRRILLSCSAALTGAAVALCGAIGFVDLIAPHLARKVTGPRHCYVLPVAFLLGGSLLVTADLIARTVFSPSELPVGAVTALVGAPFFAWIYFKKR